MQSLARASLGELESILLHAHAGGADLERATYPPGCEPAEGPVRFEVHARGGLIVRVAKAELATDDFRLAVLFGTGACVFGSLGDFHGFCAGPLAVAFGLVEPVEREDEATDEDEPAAEPQLAMTEVLLAEARTARKRRRLTAERLARRLARKVHGQDAALERIASVVSAQLAKRRPAVPGSVLLLGPTGVGKTSAIEALPRALASLGFEKAHVHRLDCAELPEEIQLTRVLGVAPGYRGHTTSTAFLDALSRSGVIVLLDEVEKAHPDLLDAILALLDTGRLTAPTGKVVECPHAIVAMTSNLRHEELAERLGDTPLHDRVVVQRVCREHLVEAGLRPELVGRIGAFAVYGELGEDARRAAAVVAVRALAAEYALALGEIDPVVVDVVLDLAEASGAGARGLRHAARDLLAESMADVAGRRAGLRWALAVGPPPTLIPA